MNNVNMNAMGGPVGGNVPMMNNGAPGSRPMPQMPANNDQRMQLNTYIYEYFLRNSMWECARSLLNSEQPLNLSKDSPGRRRDDNSTEDGREDSKDDSKQPADLPTPNLPNKCGDSCFLFEWWCLFWDMFQAQRGNGEGRNVLQYVTHTQSQSRARQEQQQAMLRGIRNGGGNETGQYQMMMRNQANGLNLNQNSNLNPAEHLRQKALQNQQRVGGPSQMQMLAQQKQQQMQRAPSDGSNQQRPQSPGSAENAPSPSKRPRLDGAPFSQQQIANGRGQGGGMPQQVGDTGPSNAIQAAHLQLTNSIEPNNLTTQQFPNAPGGQNNGNQQARVSLAGYQATLAQQQTAQAQMAAVKAMPNQGGPANQGSPMMTQGPDSAAIANYYNPVDIGANGMRTGPGGVPGAGGGGNHALQDYQMQLMLLEQQNKKRLMMARQEHDNIVPRSDGGQGAPGAVGPNGQPFQGNSPQGGRSVNSPNPGDQMKRGTPHMNNAGMPSPLPEGQSRGSPGGGGMNFNMPGQLDPNMNPQYFKMGGNGMDPSLGGAMQNGMRPPNPHPGVFQNGMTQNGMSQQQMAMARQQQMQQQGAVVQNNWANGPNGQMMPQGAQGAPQQNMGTPQPRSMPPPSAPVAGPVTNGRTQPPSPQQNPAPPTPSQTNKANPKKKAESKDNKSKRATKKGSTANLNAGTTPSADTETAATPTPATPITPVHSKSFNGQNGVVQPTANGQIAAAPNAGVVSQQPDPLQAGGFNMNDTNYDFNQNMDFANPGNGMDVLQDFDFDSFLHNDDQGPDAFNFDTTSFMDDGGIGAD